MLRAFRFIAVGLCVATVACGSDPAPTQPTPPSATLSAPTATSPAADAQLDSLRPTLTVTNPAASGTAARTYEFQISDRSDFSSSGTQSSNFAVALTQAGIGEGSGNTSFTVATDLLPAARLYWRARVAQSGQTSSWSATRSFRTQVIGFAKPGELYDPLVNGQTLAEALIKRTTLIPGKGLRVNDSDSYARYRIQPPITGGGEFSVDVEGLTDRPVSENPDTAKLKIFAMGDSLFSILFSKWLMDTQYRGFNGNPDNAISYKVLFGQDEDDHKLEPDLAARRASVVHLNPANTYLWKATFGMGFRLVVLDGGTSPSGVGGSVVYDRAQTIGIMYAPNPMYAYLGFNDSGAETGSFPNTIYRNLWIGDKPRPAALGTALVSAPASLR
jgi:hypothetical protein